MDTSLGRGTEFHVYLPVAAGQPSQPETGESGEMPRGQGEKILIVDDEALLLRVAELTLEKHGYVPIVARDGAAAVAVYVQNPGVRLVITDVAMPAVDGVALTRVLRQMNPTLPIIVCTGHTAQGRANELKMLDVEILAKPFTRERLLKAVSDGLAGVIRTERGSLPG